MKILVKGVGSIDGINDLTAANFTNIAVLGKDDLLFTGSGVECGNGKLYKLLLGLFGLFLTGSKLFCNGIEEVFSAKLDDVNYSVNNLFAGAFIKVKLINLIIVLHNNKYIKNY